MEYANDMSYLLGFLSGVILMSVISRDTNKVTIDTRCPDIHLEQPKVNTVFEESFKSCMDKLEKANEKLFECQKDNLYYRATAANNSYSD
jgi:hypothetical protein